MHHEKAINDASFSPDGNRIVTASNDNTARVWDATTGKALGEPMRHEGLVWRASFSPDSSRIVTASADKAARLWNATTGNALGEPMHHKEAINSASFSPDGSSIVTASADATARLWDATTGKPLGEPMRHELGVESASFSPDGSRIVTASQDATARVWDAATGKPLGEPMGHQKVVESASFSPDGGRIVTASFDNTARVWDAATGKAFGGPMRHLDFVRSARFSPDGGRIVTASHDRTARVWEMEQMFHLPSVTPEWVREWARVLAGWKFDSDGMIQVVAGTERTRILSTPHEGDDPWSRLAKWLTTDSRKRTTHPDSTHTCREIAERERDFGSKESLESALRYDPTVPLARLMLAMFENPQRAGFLRDYDLNHLPDDPSLWLRATQSLHEQKDDSRARRALDKLATLAPDQARKLKLELDF
jgi:WD40 repeat protein